MRLRCYTAGSAMSDLTVHGLTADDAEKVRQYLLEQIRDDAAMSDTVNGNETGD